MLKGFLEEIPIELEEAAWWTGRAACRPSCGCSCRSRAPGLLAAGVVVFAFDWAEFLFAFILTATPQAMTFPVGVQGLVTQFEIIWNDMAAGGVIAIAGASGLMLVARRYVVAGLTFGVIRDK